MKKTTLVSTLVMLLFGAFIFTQNLQAADEDFDDFESSDEAVDSSTTADIEVLGPFGGNTWDIAIDSERNMLYVTAKDSPNGIYRSADGGETWTGLSGVDYGGGVAVEVDPDTGDVFALSNNGLYRSTDGGVTYTKTGNNYGSAIKYANGVLLMADTEIAGKMFISEDNAETFSESTLAEDIYTILYIADSPTIGEFYVVGFDSEDMAHVYRTSNSGADWEELAIPDITDNSWGAQLAVNPTNPDHIVLSGSYDGISYQSFDGGDSWETLLLQSQAIAFNSTGRLYFNGQYSDDAGEVWVELGRDENDNNTAIGGHVMAIDSSNEEVIYADGMPGISKSTDGGQTWDDINAGIAGVTITDISQATDKDIVWAAAYNGVAKTENFTSENPTWEFPILPDPATAVWTQPDNPDVVVVGEIREMKRTEDGGETWSDNLVEGLMSEDYQVNEIIQDTHDTNTLYAAVGNAEPNNPKTGMVLWSDDTGETWNDLEITDNASAQTIAQSQSGALYVGLGAEGGTDYVAGVYKYDDGEWSFLTNSPAEEIMEIAIDPNDDNTVYAVASIAYGNNDTGKFGFYKSEDAGVTWNRVTENLDQLREFNSLAIQASTDPATLYLGAVNYQGQGVLYKSSDGGDTWGLLYTGLKEETFYTMIFDGVTAGTSRGLFDIKSKSSVNLKIADKTIKVGKKAKLIVTLKDATTDKKLNKKKIQLLKKKGSTYKKQSTKKTNAKGKVTFNIRMPRVGKYKYKVSWAPKSDDAEEYISVTSGVKTVTVQKKKN